MRSVAPLATPQVAPQPVPQFPAAWYETLDALRVVARRCRVAPRTDLFRACALIANTKSATHENYTQALFRCIGDAIGRNPVFYRPGTTEVSFDEAWLIRAVMAATEGDEGSLRFLVGSRVPKVHRRHIRFLISGIAQHANKT